MGFGFDLLTSLFPFLFLAVFALVIGVFVVGAVKGISQWNRNNHAPRLTVPARVVGKRDRVSHHHHDDHMHTSTTYYVTFEVDSGDRMELQVSGEEFGMLVDGDRGQLSFQGTRYLGFQRECEVRH